MLIYKWIHCLLFCCSLWTKGRSVSDDDGEEDEEVDYFQDMSSGPDDEKEGEDRVKRTCYGDFFDPPQDEAKSNDVMGSGRRTKHVRFERLEGGNNENDVGDDDEEEEAEMEEDVNGGVEESDSGEDILGLDDRRGKMEMVLGEDKGDVEEKTLSRHQKKNLLVGQQLYTLPFFHQILSNE